MRILLVNTNMNQYLAPLPIGLAYLVGPLKRNGFCIKVLDLMYSQRPHEKLLNVINDFKPEVVGFSIRNLDNQYLLDLKNPLPIIKELINIAKKQGILTVLGGTAFTTMPKEMLDYMEADYGISGQGEESLLNLLTGIKNRIINYNTPGLVWRESGKIKANNAVIQGYAKNCLAEWDGIDLKKYRKTFWPGCVLTKTGCQFQCSYCDAQTTMGNKFIFRDFEAIIDDIKLLKKRYNLRYFHLADPCFNYPVDWAKELLKIIIREKININFNTTILPIPGSFDSEFFELYKKAGGIFTILGSESFSQTMLESYNKPFTIDEIKQWTTMANKHGLKFGVELLIGGPGETENTVRESMDFLSRVNYSLFLYSIGIRIVPNTKIYNIAKSEGIINETSELLFPKFYLSNQIDLMTTNKYITKISNRYGYRNMRLLPFLMRNKLHGYINL